MSQILEGKVSATTLPSLNCSIDERIVRSDKCVRGSSTATMYEQRLWQRPNSARIVVSGSAEPNQSFQTLIEHGGLIHGTLHPLETATAVDSR
jgi:hypothetical protein